MQEGEKSSEKNTPISLHIRYFLELCLNGIILICIGIFISLYDSTHNHIPDMITIAILFVLCFYIIFLCIISPKINYEKDDEISIRDMNKAVTSSIRLLGGIAMILSVFFIVNDIFMHWFLPFSFGWEIVLYVAGLFEIVIYIIFENLKGKSDFE